MENAKGSPQPVDPAVRDRLVRAGNELLASGLTPEVAVVRLQLAHVRDVPATTVYRSAGQPEAGEVLLDRGDMGPRFTHFEDGWYKQQVVNRAIEARVMERLRKHLANEIDLFRKAVRGWIKSGKVPAGDV